MRHSSNSPHRRSCPDIVSTSTTVDGKREEPVPRTTPLTVKRTGLSPPSVDDLCVALDQTPSTVSKARHRCIVGVVVFCVAFERFSYNTHNPPCFD
ncbi:Hypothetical protein SMAX5B_001846 [Scophthalmus maximus]|uniref:Uncharacterized protein n=1 Tax=Scophthalmus maximus TaxID=52904 RepID=A0A2U9CYX2_SCOMX|nr:Hypothetical protein SMAX5B_001846 [Scophthalmus maximus]KAF0028436.1 hypothetical protein F2P81_019523 [Scophthalmus maximus]